MSARNGAGTDAADFARCMGPVALEVLGEPAQRSKDELRWGTRGSLCVDTSKGTWHDHEANEGGGVLDFVQRQCRLDKADALAWLHEHGHLPPLDRPKATSKREIAAYPYLDAEGRLLFQVVRFDPKDFRQRRPDGSGGWAWNMQGVPRVLYRLGDVLAAVKIGRVVHVVEGEKAADALRALGLTATCSPGGAGKWRPEYNPVLDGASVVILPDHDDPGRAHADQVAAHLRGHAVRIRRVELPGLPPKGDVVDWLAAGGTSDLLLELGRNAPLLPAGVEEPARPAPNVEAKAPQEAPLDAPGRVFGRLRLLSVADALSAPPRTYFLDGLLAAGEMSVWWGPPKSGKSFLMLRIAYGLALGRGMWGREAEAMPVLYCAAEGESGVNGRIAALHATMGNAPAFHFIAQSVDLFDPNADLSSIIEAIRFTKAGLFVADTLARVMGSGDENKTPDMNAFVRNFDTIREQTGAHAAAVHHGGWEGAHARGSIALIGAADLVMKVSGSRETPHSALVEYNKDGPDGDLLGFKLDAFNLPPDAKGRPRTTCIAAETDTPAEPAKAPGKGNEEAATLLRDIHNAIASGLGTMAQPVPEMPLVPSIQRSVLQAQLIQSGWIQVSNGVSNDGATTDTISHAEHSRLWKRLNHLKMRGEVGFNRDCLWLPKKGVTT